MPPFNSAATIESNSFATRPKRRAIISPQNRRLRLRADVDFTAIIDLNSITFIARCNDGTSGRFHFSASVPLPFRFRVPFSKTRSRRTTTNARARFLAFSVFLPATDVNCNERVITLSLPLSLSPSFSRARAERRDPPRTKGGNDKQSVKFLSGTHL